MDRNESEEAENVMSAEQQASEAEQASSARYAKYVLFVLIIVYIFNFIDRQILSILAEEIKADLGIGDAEIGFLYGTAFAVFYAVFGIPLGRLADMWNRKKINFYGLVVLEFDDRYVWLRAEFWRPRILQVRCGCR
ncbi:MFS transporter [Pseudomonadales bacterium]|nr:MFS transporter [Pseudomonadales bacterium]